jgi:hypothetical protein
MLLFYTATLMCRYRLNVEKAEWIIYVTDVGQSQHFEMFFAVCAHPKISCILVLNFCRMFYIELDCVVSMDFSSLTLYIVE